MFKWFFEINPKMLQLASNDCCYNAGAFTFGYFQCINRVTTMNKFEWFQILEYLTADRAFLMV